MNIDTGEIRAWASLSEEERKSGRWIQLPGTDEDGQPIRCRKDAEHEASEILRELAGDAPRGEFGKPRIGSNGRAYVVNDRGQYQRVR